MGIKRIMVVDDHPIVSDGLSLLLNVEEDLEVCGFAEDADRAMDKIKKLRPDLMVIDISLKDGVSGVELTKTINKRYPSLPILVLSMHDENLYAERVIRAGAKGYIMKHEMTGIIVDAIRKILNGEIFLSEKMTSRLIDSLHGCQSENITNPIEQLTNRELEVFQMIGQGFRSTEIAEKLDLSVKTVDTYKLRIKNKLNIQDSAHLTKLAIEWSHSI